MQLVVTVDRLRLLGSLHSHTIYSVIRLGIIIVTNILILVTPVLNTVQVVSASTGVAETVNSSENLYVEPTLEEKYSKLAGEHYYSNVTAYLPVIDSVLREKGLEEDSRLIKVMFYVGMRESGWGQNRVSSFLVGNEHPTGIFQFLPSTFRTVSSGDIFSVEDQVRAFITMMERGRVDEYHVMHVCGYAPCLTNDLKEYAFNYSFNQTVFAGQSKDVK